MKIKGLLLISCLTAISFFTGCGDKDKLEEVNFKETIELEELTSAKKPEINICVGSMITPKEGYAYYKALLDYIGSALGVKVNFIERESYFDVNALLEEGKIDVAFVCGGPYVEGKKRFGLELLVAPQIDGKAAYHSYIIVKKDSGIKTFNELKGKTFVFADPMSNSGKAYPTYLIKNMGYTPESFFSEYTYSYAHDASIKAVSEGLVNGGAVDSLIWNYMDKTGSQYTKNTKVINTSPEYGIPPVVVRPGLDKKTKDKLKQVLLDMHNHKDGKQILLNMMIDKFVEINDAEYNSIRKMKRYIKNENT